MDPGPPWIDVSVPLHPGLPTWPGDPPLALERASAMERGDAANVTRLATGAHVGTHVDAPLHFLAGGRPVDGLPLDALVGPARVVELPGRRAIGEAELAPLGIGRGERLLLRTDNSAGRWFEEPFRADFVHLRPDAARHLAARGVALLGVDYLSVGGFADAGENALTHRILLEAGVVVLEGLFLGAVTAGRHDLVALPLRIAGADGAPARALVRPRP